MADTTFIDKQTVITAAWAQDVNNLVYRGVWPSIPASFTINLSAASTAVTAATGTNTTAVASTAFVQQEINNTTVKQLDTAFTTTGTSGVYTLTPTIPLASLVANTRYRVKFHLASTGGSGSTLQISALAPQSVFQYDSNGNKVNPTIATGQLADVEWDGAAFVILDPLPPVASPVVGATPIRQTVQAGAVDTSGRANFITVGSGLVASLSATATPVTMTFSAGFSAGGQQDFVERITADNATYWSGLAASNLNFLTMNRVSLGVVNGGSTLAPPQYGFSYDQTKQALLHFDGAAGSTTMLDDFGNTWTAQSGAKLQTNSVKFGTAGLGGTGTNNALNGTSDYVKSTNFAFFPSGGWALRAWVNPSALPASAASVILVAAHNASSFGAALKIFNNAGTIRFAYDLSSNGTSNDIASGVQGTTLPVTGTYYFVELTFDAVAGIYRLYVNGAQEQSTTSALKVAGFTNISLGAQGTGANFFNGYIDEFEYIPYCDHPNATSYSVPVGAKSISTAGYASDWFDISTYTLKSPSVASASAGTNPTFTTSNKLYVGEATTAAASVSNVISYAYQGQYKSADTAIGAVGSRTAFAANLGIPTDFQTTTAVIKNYATDLGFTPGMVTYPMTNSGAYTQPLNPITEDRNTLSLVLGNTTNIFLLHRSTGVNTSITAAANWRLYVTSKRSF